MVTGARKLFCWAGPLEPVARLEVFGRPFSGCRFSSTRSGQSSAVMSQKRHSCLLGTRIAGYYNDGLPNMVPDPSYAAKTELSQ